MQHNGRKLEFSESSKTWYEWKGASVTMVPMGQWSDLEAAARAAGLRIPKAVVAKAVPVRVDKPKARHKNSVMIFMGV